MKSQIFQSGFLCKNINLRPYNIMDIITYYLGNDKLVLIGG